jgi:hypothetical protein
MSRPVVLNALEAGISRLRSKGGANPRTLYDLLNGYVTIEGTIKSRPGTEEHTTALAGTIGLCAFDGELVVFASEAVAVPSGYRCEILTHPTDPTATLSRIHFAGPFTGFLYVVAEWDDEAVFHYWLRSADEWVAEKIHFDGDLVQPTTPNGFIYRASRATDPNPLWAPNVERTVADVVEPTVASGYKHTVVSALGANPRSGPTEPVWATGDGNLTIEDADSDTAPVTAPIADPDTALPVGNPGRYRLGIEP